MSPSPSRISEFIHELMASGLSQSEIGRRAGIPQPRISRWASGDVPVGADDALRLQELRNSVVATAGQPNAA
jgi:transcriptional regulator with XRE-family HTH domain